MRLPKKKAVKAAVAGLAASAMLLTAMPAYAGIGSGGVGVHGGGSNVGPSGESRIVAMSFCEPRNCSQTLSS